MEYQSTSAVAILLNIPPSDLFSFLKSKGWIEKVGDKWALTETGKAQGGQMKHSTKYGDYIVWPETLQIDIGAQSKIKPRLINATAIGKHFGISNQRLNLILSELGWIEKNLAGWAITKSGIAVGGKQFEHDTSGATYVIWPESITTNKSLIDVFTSDHSSDHKPAHEIVVSDPGGTLSSFRTKYEAKHRSLDGHFVRSKSEMLIDNILYQYGIVHAYERKLPVDEDVYCDFYLPAGKVYIEYWGLENDPAYDTRKVQKLEIYRKYDFNLIELNEQDIQNLDDHLPKKLLRFNIKVY